MALNMLTLGGATFDSIIDYANPETLNLHSARGTLSYLLLEEGKKIEITSLDTSIGGGATNSAVAFTRLGFDTRCLCKVGDDVIGDQVIRALNDFGVHTDCILRAPGVPTAISTVIPSLQGDRTVFAYRGANATIKATELPWDLIKQHEQLYITSLSGESAECFPEIIRFAKKHQLRVAVNPGISQLRQGGAFIAEALDGVEILMLNSAEAKQLMVSLLRAEMGSAESAKQLDKQIAQFNHPDSPELLFDAIHHEELSFSLLDFFHRVMRLGPSVVVVTHGGNGVYVADSEKVYFHPPVTDQVVNTLGAGDAFSATFVAALRLGHSVAEAIRWGVINSASVISFKDAKTGLLSHDTLLMRVNKLAPTLLQDFPYAVAGR